MVNYSHVFEFSRLYYPTHVINERSTLAPYGFPHRGPLPGIRSLDILPDNFPPRLPPQYMRHRNPGLRINTQAAQRGYTDGRYEDTTSYFGNY